MRPMSPADRDVIVVGRALPFAIHGSDRTLLLAAGRVVPNEFVREGLRRSGAFCVDQVEQAPDEAKPPSNAKPRTSAALEALLQDYGNTSARATVGFRMQQGSDTTAHTAQAVGATDSGALIMTGPYSMTGERVLVANGESWTFRAFYALAAIKFEAVIASSSNEPFAHFYLTDLQHFERKAVRHFPRVPTAIPASRQEDPERVIVDLSVGGARIAVDRSPLQKGQAILLSPTLKLLDREMPLALEAVVLNLYGHADPKHPGVEFYGVQFEQLNELSKLALHGYVQEHLCAELDRVWHALSLRPS